MSQTKQGARQREQGRAGASRAVRPPSSMEDEITLEAGQSAAPDFVPYRTDPARFAREVLASCWWSAQEEIAALVAGHRRVAIKAANGVGKTYLAADLALWFLYCHRPSLVLTTAPTWRQVESLLWEEIRRRHNAVNVAAEFDPTRPKLEGSLMQTRLKIADGHFAMGLSTDEPVRFQGFHAENLLVVLDEACGVPEEIWDAVEGVCVGGNNRVLAISNPLSPAGRFYGLFKSPRWKTYTLSALTHPNVVEGVSRIPGAVTREAIEDRIASWCEEEKEGNQADSASVDTVLWQGRRYRPNGLFRARVLGEFPESATDSLIALSWIEEAMKAGKREEENEEPNAQRLTPHACILSVDVARFGADETVIAVRRGDVVTRLWTYQGLDTMKVAGRVIAHAMEERAEAVVVDEVGVGAGVVDRLEEQGLSGLLPVHFGARPLALRDADQFLNLRAQTFWALRDRFRMRRIRLPHDEKLSAQLANLRYTYTSAGQIQIESKDEMRRRGLPSPDRADALALLFMPLAGQGPFCTDPLSVSGAIRQEERAVPVHWDEVGVW